MFPEDVAKKIRLEMAETTPENQVSELPDQYDLRPRRVRARFCLFAEYDPNEEPPKCVIDTGAPFTILPRKVWSKHQHQITWLNSRSTVRGIGGASIDADLGLVEMWVFSGRSANIGPRIMRSVIAKCAHDGMEGSKEIPMALFGIGGGTLDNGGLCLNFAQDECYLVQLNSN